MSIRRKTLSPFWRRLLEPVIVDRSIDLLSGLSWILYGIWGVLAVSARLVTLSRVVGTDYTIPWGAGIACLGLIAGLAALSTLSTSPTPVRIIKKQIELWSVSILTGFIAVYPALLLVRSIETWDLNIWSQFVLGMYFIVFPIWRIRHLTNRVRGLREIENQK